MADDASNYRDLMAQLEAAFAPHHDSRGLSEPEHQPTKAIDAGPGPFAGSSVEMGQPSGTVGLRNDLMSLAARLFGDEEGRPAGYGVSANAGPVGYQQSRPMQRGAAPQHTFTLNLDPREVEARLQAILLQGPGGQRSYGVGANSGNEEGGWNLSGMYDPQRRALSINGGMQRRFAEGGSAISLRERLLNMLKGDDYQSTGQKTVDDGTVNWGDPENAADFFRADKARMEMERKLREDESRPAPSRVIESRPPPPPDSRQAAPEEPAAQRTIPGAQSPLQSDSFVSASAKPIAYAPDEKPAALRAIEDATDKLNIRDISHMAQYRGSAMEEPEAVVFHHTAGRGTPEGVVNTLNNRVDPFTGRKMILGVHYIIDRDGSVHAALPSGTTGAHVLTNQERNLSNQNTIGVEVIAKDNDDVTPEQVEAGKLLHAYLSSGRKKPLEVFGHGELNPGHKLPNEGLAVVNPIRNRFKIDAARGYAEGGSAKSLRQAIMDLEGPEAQGAISPSGEGFVSGIKAVGEGLDALYRTPELDPTYGEAPAASTRQSLTPAMLAAQLDPEAQGARSPSLQGVGEGMQAMGEDPFALVGGFLPGVGNALAASDVSHLKDKIEMLRGLGEDEKADTLQKILPFAAMGAVMPVGAGAATRAMIKNAEKAAAKGATRELFEGVEGATGRAAKRAVKGEKDAAALIDDSAIPAGSEVQYVTEQDGPFLRVSRVRPEGDRAIQGLQDEIRIGSGAESADVPRTRGSIRDRVPTYDEERALDQILKDPERNRPRQALDQYLQETFGRGLEPVEISDSSLTKQSAIGRVYEMAAEGKEPYKKAVFEAYRKQMPEVVEAAGAKSYDELMAAAYKQLSKETAAQFDRLPANMSFYRNGEGAYADSRQMLHDLHGDNHLTVFQGGEPHDFLNEIDPRTGLNANEKFRAVHDAYGHGIGGYMFGPKGEERAWAMHQQSYSPLAQLAMTSETRGQNSFVNYTPINAELKSAIYDVESKLADAKQYGWRDRAAELQAQKDALYQELQFAPNKGLLLPPEFLSTKYEGGMPDYVQKLIRPREGTQYASDLTHFSHDPDLRTTDPSRYGTGIAGDETARLIKPDGETRPGAVSDRSYFYLGNPSEVRPEEGLGSHVYTTRSDNLYNMTEDPEKLALLAQMANRRSPLSSFNPGTLNGQSMANDLERLAREYGYEGVANPNAAFPMAAVFKPKDVAPKVVFNGKEPHQFGPQDWGDYGRAHGVENLGPASEADWLKSLGVVRTRSGRDVTIPGGLEAKDPFTYYDLLHLKSQGINPNDLEPAQHQAIHDRMVKALQPGPGGASNEQIANQMLFGLISPNQPLTPNELALQRVMIKSPKDLDQLANMVPYHYTGEIPSKAERNAMSRKITQMYGLQAAPEGLGVSGSANYTDLAEFAQKMKDRPDFYRFDPNDPSMAGMSDSEKWATHVGRVLNETRGLKAKTASLGSVWQSPEDAAISAIDRHMATKFRSDMFPNRKEARAWEKETLAKFNEDRPKKERVKTIDALLAAPGGRGHFVDEALAYVNNLPTSTMRMKKTGEYNPAVPRGLRDVNWIGKEPEKVQVVGGPYVRALEANQAEATKAGQGLFANQWMLWDRIRNRLEPHEILFPGLEKLPRMNLEQMKGVQRAHRDLGYMAAEGAVRPESNASRLGYFSVPLAVGAVGEEAMRRRKRDSDNEFAIGGPVSLQDLASQYDASSDYAKGGSVQGYAFGGLFDNLMGHINNIGKNLSGSSGNPGGHYENQIVGFQEGSTTDADGNVIQQGDPIYQKVWIPDSAQTAMTQQAATTQDTGLNQLAANYGENAGGTSAAAATDADQPYFGGNLIMTEAESKQYDDLINAQQGSPEGVERRIVGFQEGSTTDADGNVIQQGDPIYQDIPLPPTKPAYLQNFDYSQYADPLAARYAFLSKALNPTIAAAAMGNFQAESGNNPNQLQTTTGTATGTPLYTKKAGFENLPTGYGSAQWGTTRLTNLGANNPNKLGLYDFAERYGFDPNTTEGQDRFVVYELTTNPEYRNVYKNLLKSGNDVAGATYIFGSGYESPANLRASINQRQQDAAMYQNLYTNGMDKLTEQQRQRIANTQKNILDPYFNKLAEDKAAAEAKRNATETAIARTGNDLGDVGFNPVTDTSVNDRIMQDSNTLLNQGVQNSLNYNYTDPFYAFNNVLSQSPFVQYGSGGAQTGYGQDPSTWTIPDPGAGMQLYISPYSFDFYSPYAEGGSVGFKPMFDGDSEILQSRAKQLARQAYTDPKTLTPNERKEWNQLAGKYNLPPSSGNKNTYEEQTEETMTGLQKGLSSRQKERTYAKGGLVYDPAEIDAIAAQIRGAI
jgi:hypothetical protein